MIAYKIFSNMAEFLAFVNGTTVTRGVLTCASTGTDVASADDGFADVLAGHRLAVSGYGTPFTVASKADDENITLSDDVTTTTDPIPWVAYQANGIGWSNVLTVDLSVPSNIKCLYRAVTFGA